MKRLIGHPHPDVVVVSDHHPTGDAADDAHGPLIARGRGAHAKLPDVPMTISPRLVLNHPRSFLMRPAAMPAPSAARVID